MNRPIEGLREDDLIDMHEVIGTEESVDFKDKYYQLLPTWNFLKQIVRQALINKINS
jgi:hypothetical protein